MTKQLNAHSLRKVRRTFVVFKTLMHFLVTTLYLCKRISPFLENTHKYLGGRRHSVSNLLSKVQGKKKQKNKDGKRGGERQT